MKNSLIVADSFFKDAKKLRQDFETRFANPHEVKSNRFIWDYWHIPEQYTTLRTPAYHFFNKKTYEAFHNQLVWWGRRTLGCHDISPPWLSCYVDGCKQEIHGDLPHGPWAFVYSLTPWKTRKFTGGETFLLKNEILNYWSEKNNFKGLEQENIYSKVPAQFNRLVVFDPRIPHGVKEVKGVHDVLQGRLVIHGWFVQPRPFIEGPLPTDHLADVIEDLSHLLNQLFQSGLFAQGVLSLHFSVNKNGNVLDIKVLSNCLRSSTDDNSVEIILRSIKTYLKKTKFRKQRGASSVTLPLIFDLN